MLKNRSAVDVQNQFQAIDDSILLNEKLNEIDSVQHADDVHDSWGAAQIQNTNDSETHAKNTMARSKNSQNQAEGKSSTQFPALANLSDEASLAKDASFRSNFHTLSSRGKAD